MFAQVVQYFTKHTNQKYCAIGANILCGTLVSISGVFMKLSKSGGNDLSTVLGICGVLINITYCSCFFPQKRFRFRLEDEHNGKLFTLKDTIKCLLLGGIFSGAYAHFYFISLRYLTMGDAIAVSFCVHFVSNLILETLVLRAIPHILTLVAGLIGVGGLLLICQPKSLLNLEFDMTYTTGVYNSCFVSSYTNVSTFKSRSRKSFRERFNAERNIDPKRKLPDTC